MTVVMSSLIWHESNSCISLYCESGPSKYIHCATYRGVTICSYREAAKDSYAFTHEMGYGKDGHRKKLFSISIQCVCLHFQSFVFDGCINLDIILCAIDKASSTSALLQQYVTSVLLRKKFYFCLFLKEKVLAVMLQTDKQRFFDNL